MNGRCDAAAAAAELAIAVAVAATAFAAPLTGNVAVNQNTVRTQQAPRVALQLGGGFLVAWEERDRGRRSSRAWRSARTAPSRSCGRIPRPRPEAKRTFT